MKCRRVRELMGAYLYGDLSPTEMREVRLHTQECYECREDLHERGMIIASLGDANPVISDDERQSIAWSVKGAIRQKEQEREYSRVRLSPAYIIIVVLAVGLVLGSTISARMGSHKAEAPPQKMAVKNEAKKDKAPEKATVEITEERLPQKDIKDEKSNHISDEVIKALNKTLVPAISAGSSTHRSRPEPERENMVNKDTPAPVVSQDEAKQVNESTDTTQLPKPQDINDAQTTEKTNDQ